MSSKRVISTRMLARCLPGVIVALAGCASPQAPSSGDRDSALPGPPATLASWCAKPTRVDGVSDNDLGRLWSVCTVWYRNNPLPVPGRTRPGSEHDWTSACEAAFGQGADARAPSSDTERAFLQSALGVGHPDDEPDLLCAFAISDVDRDEVLDFRVTEHGRFVENDTDVDADGVPNIRDAHPTDPARGQAAHCGQGALPEHLALVCDADTGRACELQQRLYHDYDIVLLNRDFPPGDPRILRSTAVLFDAVHLVYGENFSSHPTYDPDCRGLPTLKTLAFEQCVTRRTGPWAGDPWPRLAACVSEDDWDTSAEARAHNASIVFYPPDLDSPGLIALGTFVHELAHSWTFAYDYDPVRQHYLLENNYWETPNFKALLETFGWGIDTVEPQIIAAQRDLFDRVVSASNEIVQFDEGAYTLNGVDLETHLQILDREDIEYSRHARQHGLVGTYALSNPWEWYPETVQAYLYRALEDHVFTRVSKRAGQQVRELLRAHAIETWGNQAYYPNIDDDIYQRFATEILPLSDAALDELTCRYLIYSDDFLFQPLQESVTPRGDRITLDELKHYVRTQWRDVCSDVMRLSTAS